MIKETKLYFAVDVNPIDESRPLMAITMIWGKDFIDYLEYNVLDVLARQTGKPNKYRGVN